MRRTLRCLVVATTLAAPLMLASAANAYTIQITEDNCVDIVPATPDYNNGDPNVEPGHIKVNNCAT